MDKAVDPVGVLGLGVLRQGSHELACDVTGVDHDALGGSRVDAAACNGHSGRDGMEGLVLVPAQVVTV